MNHLHRFFWILLTFLSISCVDTSETANNNGQVTTTNEILEVTGIEIPDLDTQALIEDLQGVWREPDYPFNRVEFRNSTVKMVEEGVAEPAQFRSFNLAHHCPYEVNNMQNSHPADTILIIDDMGRCEKLSLRGDTLILSGFNSHTGSDYATEFIAID